MKRILSLCLVAAIAFTLAPPAKAFSDIQSPLTSVAAEGLASIGILAQADAYNPNNSLTRGEFCKLATLSAGFDESTLYSSYTIFPDVLNTKWFAPYVNASVKKYKIILGRPSGLFNPEEAITSAEVITICLRMLGYKDESVGPFWPRDYMVKAQQVGLTRGLESLVAGDPITRGNAAILLSNMLSLATAENAPYINTGFSSKADCVLVDTYLTNPTLKEGQVTLNDGKDNTVYDGVNLPTSLTGLFGTAIFDKKNPSRMIGFLPTTKGVSILNVKSVDDSGITTTTGKVSVPRTVKTSVMGSIADYSTSWFDIKPENTVFVYYNESGAISAVAVYGTTAGGSSHIYGVEEFRPISGASFIHNGTKIDVNKLQKYDVLSYSKQNNTYYVSNNTLTLRYENSGPTYNNPTYIEAGGMKFTISDAAAPYFKDVKFGQVISLLFDSFGNVRGTMSQFSTTSRGILTKLTDSEFEAVMDNGVTIKGTPNLRSMDAAININGERKHILYKSVGQFVNVSQETGGNYRISPITVSRPGFSTPSFTIDSAIVSPNVTVYEQATDYYPLHKVERSKVTGEIPVTQITHVEYDRNGLIDKLVVRDLTGDLFIYGLVKQSSENFYVPGGFDDIQQTKYTTTVRNSQGEKSFSTLSLISIDARERVGAVAKDLFENPNMPSVSLKEVTSFATVGRDDFDSIRGVRVGKKYYKMSENLQVYSTSLNRFMTLSEARANFKSFELFGNDIQVNMIIAQ